MTKKRTMNTNEIDGVEAKGHGINKQPTNLILREREYDGDDMRTMQ